MGAKLDHMIIGKNIDIENNMKWNSIIFTLHLMCRVIKLKKRDTWDMSHAYKILVIKTQRKNKGNADIHGRIILMYLMDVKV